MADSSTYLRSRLFDLASREVTAICGYLIVLVLWLVANAGVSATSAIGAVAVLSIIASPVLVILRKITGHIGIAEVALSFAIGFTLSGIISILLRYAELPTWLPTVFFGVAFIILTLSSTRLRLRDGEYRAPSTVKERSSISTAIAATIILLPLSVVLVRGALAGSGTFPSYIFYSDDAYDLAMIQSLLASPTLPPHSLTFAGGIKPYHFAALEAVANLVRQIGISPHVALFYLAFPILEAGIIGAAWLFLRRIPKGMPLILSACLLVVALNNNQNEFRINVKVLSAYWHAITLGSFTAEPTLKYIVAHLPTTAARLFAWSSFSLLLSWDRWWAKIIVTILTGSLSVIDPFYFAAFGLLFGLWAVYNSWRRRQVGEILPAVSAFLIGIGLMHISGSSDATFRIAFEPFGCDYCTENTIETLRNLALIAGCALVLALSFRNRMPALGKIWLLTATILLLTVNLTTLTYANQSDTNFNWFRVATILPMLITGFTSAIVGATWLELGKLRLLIGAAICVSTLLSAIRIPLVALQVAANPARGDDVAQTSFLAEALQSIPIKGTLIVTNDLRYPVVDYRYTLKNPLVSALFGHQCYFCNGDGEGDLPGAADRLAEVQSLASPAWSQSIADLAHTHHWTHFLVHKTWSHPLAMPLTLVYENDQYAVYAF